MQRNFFKKLIPVSLSFVLLCLTAFTAKAGLDSYEIYLNNKLILKQYVNQPLTLISLQLTQKNAADELVIYYSQCKAPGKIGKNRSISVRDANGQTLKSWKFSDASGNKTAMVIPVKELLQLEKNNAGKELSLFYTAEGKSEGQMLANFHLGQKSTASRKMQAPSSVLSFSPFFSFIQPICL